MKNTDFKFFFIAVLAFCVWCLGSLSAASLPTNLPIRFLENKGQYPSNVLFRADIPIGSFFIERDQLTYLFEDKAATAEMQHGKQPDKIHFHSVKVQFLGASNQSGILKDEVSSTYYNFFKGAPETWASHVNAYRKVTIHNIYPLIDLELIGEAKSIKINFNIQPGGNPDQIKMLYKGMDQLQLSGNTLSVQTSLGTMEEQSPVSIQQTASGTQYINTNFIKDHDIVGFQLASYDHQLPLVLDPTVVFGTFTGSVADNFGFAACFDAAGNAYGAGTVYAANFPVTFGAYDVNYLGGSGANGEYARDAFVVKFSPDGSNLLFGTFLGGTNNEQPHSLSINSNNELMVFGTTFSSNFPTTAGAYNRTYRGQGDIFVCKFSLDGSTLLASTFVGGAQSDGINGDPGYGYSGQTVGLPYNYADWFRGEIISDQNNNVYVATCTRSKPSDNIGLVNPTQATFAGGTQDGFLFKLNSSLTAMSFSTYIGGTGDDAIYSLALDNLNNILICGGTSSSNLLGTSLSGSVALGSIDGFIGRINSSGSLNKMIYCGTTSYDQCFFVQTDANNDIYTMGQTAGSMLSVGNAYYQPTGKQFIRKYDPTLTTILQTTLFGPGNSLPQLSPSAFLVDICGRVYVSGWGGQTNSSYHFGLPDISGFPLSTDAFQKTTDGSDFYLVVFESNLKSVLYGSYYGGIISHEHVDGGTSHFDKAGIVYQSVCAGCGGYSDFPTSLNAYSRTNNGVRTANTSLGGCNLAMFKFDLRTYLSAPVFQDTILRINAGDKIQYTFSATDANGDMMTLTASSSIFSRSPNPGILKDTLIQAGVYRATFEWQTSCTDGSTDTLYINLTFNDNSCPTPNITHGIIRVLVQAPVFPAPYPDCLKVIGLDALQFNWTNPVPSNSFFRSYTLLRSVNGGPFVIIDTLAYQSAKSYVDSKATQNAKNNYCYKIYCSNNCAVTGDTSRATCSLVQQDTLSQIGFTNLAPSFFQLHVFDTLHQSVSFVSDDPKDSVYLNVNGSLSLIPGVTITTKNNLSAATLTYNWIPGCTNISTDTFYLRVAVSDNRCPAGRRRIKMIGVVVSPLPPTPAPVVFCPRHINADSLQIRWQTFQSTKYSNALFLLVSMNGKNLQLVDSTTNLSQTTTFDVRTFDFTSNYCYYITSKDICGYAGDTSKPACTQDTHNPPNALQFCTVTVTDDQFVNISWNAAQPDSFWRYQLYRRVGRGTAPYENVLNTETLQDTDYTDKNVQTDLHSYCYQLINTDACGSLSPRNQEACSILLQGTSKPFSNYLNWMAYNYWQDGVSRYELRKTEPGLYKDSLFSITGNKLFFATDDQLNLDNGLYQYVVTAFESPGVRNFTSQSNRIALLQAPVVYVPNAITANGDGLNDVFHAVPVFVKDFHIRIFNRWGDLVWETRDKHESFDTLVRGKELAEDVYFYVLEYDGWTGNATIKKGNFTVLR